MKTITPFISFILSILLIPITQAASQDLIPYLLTQNNCITLENIHYYTCYSPQDRIPLWSLHELKREQVAGQRERTNDYRRDSRVAMPVEASAYRLSGFDRGHMVPAADMRLDYESMSDTFFMTNMTPQRPEFNRGIWRVLENKIRKDFLATGQAGDVFVYTGIIEQENLPTLDSKVVIPEFLYKIIYNQKFHTIRSYLISNHRYSSSELESFRVSVDEIESKSGLNFFSFLNKVKEEELEQRI